MKHRDNNRLGTQQIRLLRVQPAASNGDPLVCYLKVFDIGNTPDFHAISYTWGTQVTDHYINCNNERKPVTQSCFEALISIRHFNCLFIWIDQLCVDQNNLSERGEQVVLMHKIYSTATGVYVWLGKFDLDDVRPPAQRTPSWRRRLEQEGQLIKGIGLIDFLAQHYTNLWPANCGGELVEAPINREILADDIAWTSLIKILNRAYFTRRWIIQEIVSNPSVTVVVGMRQLRWSSIERCCESLQLVRAGYTHGLDISDAHLRQHAVLSDHIYKIYMIHDIRRLFREGTPMSLGFLLNRCKGFDVKEVQDTIYAIRAIASENDRFPQPDYTATPQDICHQHAIELIKARHVKDVLPYAGTAWRKQNPLDPGHQLPTWCPDWTADIWPLYYRENKHIQDTVDPPNSVNPIQVCSDGRTLRVRSTQIATVKLTAEPTPNPAIDRLRLRNFCITHSRTNYLTDEVRDSLRLIPGTNSLQGYDWEKIKSKRFSNIDYSLQTFFADRDLLLAGTEFGVDVFSKLYEATFFWDISALYRLCVTYEGDLGLIPHVADAGDRIVFIEDVDSLVVLRDASGGDHDSNTFELLGDCYFLNLTPDYAAALDTNPRTEINII